MAPRSRPSWLTDRVMGTGAAALAVILVSPDAVVIRVVDADSWTILFWRSPFVGLALLVIGRVTSRGSVLRQFREAGIWGAVVIVSSAASMVLWVIAIKETAVANALVIFATMPLLAAALAWLILRERLAIQTWAALGSVTTAVIFLVANSVESGGTTGNLAAFGATLTGAMMIVGLRRTGGLPMLYAIAASQLLVLMVSVVPANPSETQFADVALVVAFGILMFAPGMAVFTLAPRFVAAGEVGLVMPFETVLGIAWVWILLGEAPEAIAVFSGSLIIGVLLAHSLWMARRPDPAPLLRGA